MFFSIVEENLLLLIIKVCKAEIQPVEGEGCGEQGMWGAGGCGEHGVWGAGGVGEQGCVGEQGVWGSRGGVAMKFVDWSC